jgi:hypothetical protein
MKAPFIHPIERRANSAVKRHRCWALVTVAALLAFQPSAALAYIDPGTGSMLVQSLLATIAAALVFGRTIWDCIKRLFRREKRSSSDLKN